MRLAEVIARTQLCFGQECIYELGRGGMHPEDVRPWGLDKKCDCSGFTCWCQGFSRHMGNVWLDTSATVSDANSPGGYFSQVPWAKARPGHLIVYGDAPGLGQGHIGIISVVDATGPLKAVHCSRGNYRRTGDAIGEGDIDIWKKRDGIVVRCHLIEEGAPA